MLFLERSGYVEETYHTFSYSPLTDDAGGSRGMLCVVSEETERVIGERRMATLRDLAAELPRPRAPSGSLAAAGSQLDADQRFAAVRQGVLVGRRRLWAQQVSASGSRGRAANGAVRPDVDVDARPGQSTA